MSLAVEFWEDLRRQCSVITGLATPPGDSFSVELFFSTGKGKVRSPEMSKNKKKKRKKKGFGSPIHITVVKFHRCSLLMADGGAAPPLPLRTQ